MELKIFIIGSTNYIYEISKYLLEKNDNLKLAENFINDIKYKDTENEYGYYYLDNDTIHTALKNNSILYIKNIESTIFGKTTDEFYNSNVLVMSISDFNNISTNFINNHKDNILLVWCDTKQHDDSTKLKKEINEVSYLLDKINNNNYTYLYFLDETVDNITETILQYLNSDEEIRASILSENC